MIMAVVEQRKKLIDPQIEIKRLKDEAYDLKRRLHQRDKRIQALRNVIRELQGKLDMCRERHRGGK